MGFELVSFSSGLVQRQAVNEVMKCNEYTEKFGLVLTQEQALELVETRSVSLRDSGRIEFGGGVIDKIINAFCDSPYISMYNYTQTINELIEMFYIHKNEAMDIVSDDELISFMKSSFNGVCQGSLDLLVGRELYKFTKDLRFGPSAGYSQDNVCDEDEDEEDEYE